MRRNRGSQNSNFTTAIIILVIAVLLIYGYLQSQRAANAPVALATVTAVATEASATGAPLPTRTRAPASPAPTASAVAQVPPSNQAPGGIPAGTRQRPVGANFHGCPVEGDGGDPILNRNKNRTDIGAWVPTAFSSVLRLSWPQGVERRPHDQWSAADAADIGRSEGAPLVVEAYLYGGKNEGPETPNCHSTDSTDFHIWILPSTTAQRDQGIVVEMTPRVKEAHPGWTVVNLNRVANANQKVRVSGWLMLDPEHPDQVGKTRGTIWEIHPVMRFEVQQGNTWTDLDNVQ